MLQALYPISVASPQQKEGVHSEGDRTDAGDLHVHFLKPWGEFLSQA